MATSKPSYDPVKTVEAMFMGSVARIAYVMKDPVNYAPATKAVLAETAKKFQDALDDCEIQILDAKWYLERQLSLNRAKREAKAREDSAASVKRKRDEVQDPPDNAHTTDGGSAFKRVKTQEPEEPAQQQQKPQHKSPVQEPAPQPAVAPSKPAAQPAPTAKEKPATAKPPDKPKASVMTEVKAPQPTAQSVPKPQEKSKPPEPVQPPERITTQTTTDEFPKPTQDTPADGNEAFNFESMFGEPSAEMTEGTGDDMTFDLDSLGYGGYGGDPNNLNLQDNSLNSLLPGLESYANQAGDDSSFNMPGTTVTELLGGTELAPGGAAGQTDNVNSLQQQQQTMNVDSFGLPQLGPNEFDEFLNSNDMTFDDTNALNGDGLINMESMDTMDFDSMFDN